MLNLHLLLLAGIWLGLKFDSAAQTPIITVQFANPQNDCVTLEYCLDVEFKANIIGQEIFGVNVRFFYDDDILELVDFRDFQGGYGPVAPNPPIISTSAPAGPALFNFEGAAEFINGAIQRTSTGPPPIILDTAEWTKLFQICFLVDDLEANLDTFCPPVVWDLEQDPENGGFLAGDDGVVITVVDPDPNNESLPADENVVQFNWEYIGNGPPPYGQPVDSVCSNINCALPMTWLSFTGIEKEEGNLLEWITQNEVNVSGFNIQRSEEALFWNTLDFVAGKGSLQEIQKYQFIDRFPHQGHNYYRLQQVDQDGHKHYSNIVRLSGKTTLPQNGLTIYPNPVSGEEVYVSIRKALYQGAKIQLFNAVGQLVREHDFNHLGMTLDIVGLEPGVYIVLIRNGSENLTARLVIH